jgi:hypothetical protein
VNPNAVVGGIDSIVADTKGEREEGEIDLEIAAIETDRAKEYLAVLKKIYRDKGCYR